LLPLAVLRYSPYNIAVKDVINSGILGEIINIQHLEPVSLRDLDSALCVNPS
jgi:hypothetical protein